MKLTKKNRATFTLILFLGILIGTLAWELIERLVALSGRILDLSVGPVGFDLTVVAFWLEINPGTFLGCLGAILLFTRL